jgi:ELWxxDGT repeat protein
MNPSSIYVRPRWLILFAMFVLLTLLLAQGLPTRRPVQASDVEPVPLRDSAGNEVFHPRSLTNVNGTLFFTAYAVNDTYDTGIELWKSDGTAAGTMLVKDINPGSASSHADDLANIDGTLFFTADDGHHGIELWKSDGTAAGTTLVKDISPGSGSSYPGYLTDVNGTLFFTVDYGISAGGVNLWKSDGTADGTVLVKRIETDFNSGWLEDLTNINGTLFFSAEGGSSGVELWKSDGTADGTVMIKDICPGVCSSYPHSFIEVNGTIFFAVQEGLWKSNGTEIGTIPVKENLSNSGPSGPEMLTNMDGTLFFSAYDHTHGDELWRSDGTAAGTTLVKDISPGSSGSNINSILNVDGTLFIAVGAEYSNAPVNGLWKSDGTTAGTTHVKQLFFKPLSWDEPGVLVNVDGTLFLHADDGIHGDELWRSDGTTAGTTLVKDIVPGSNDLSFEEVWLTSMNGMLFFKAYDDADIEELWVYRVAESPTPTSTVTATATASPSSTPTSTATATATVTPTPTGTATVTATPTPTSPSEPTDALVPTLTIDYAQGRPGSAFTIRGQHFPANTQATVQLYGPMGLLFEQPLAIDATGSFLFILDTHGLPPGFYRLVIRLATPGLATVTVYDLTLELTDVAPLRTPASELDAIIIQARPDRDIYLPLMVR